MAVEIDASREGHLSRGIVLEYLTIGWNVIEGTVAVISGAVSGSIALVGFGVDSLIETSSGLILLWRLRAERSGHDAERAERIASRLVGVSFMLLAAYIGADSLLKLLHQQRPDQSLPGIVIATLSLIIMPWLAFQKRKTASGLNSVALHADSRQTSICAYLSVILLGGLLLNAFFDWWWADPIAALAMVPIIVKEGQEALRGKACKCH